MNKQQAIPDYKRLSQTPKLKIERQLRQQIQMGSTRAIRIKGHRPAIPLLQSDRTIFPSKSKSEGIAFIGNNATLVVNRGGWKVIPETENKDGKKINKTEEVSHRKPEKNAHEAHAVNFVDAIFLNALNA